MPIFFKYDKPISLPSNNKPSSTKPKKHLGYFDPARLLSPPEKIQSMVKDMIDGFGTTKYIANLGHGILPNVPVENAQAFIEAVVNYKKD